MLSEEDRHGIGVALNEATWFHLQVHSEARSVALGLRVLTLPPTGPETDDNGRWLVLRGVSRLAASYRMARWDDAAAPAVPLTLQSLSEAIERLGPAELYGWEFIDPEKEKWKESSERLSLDVLWHEPKAPHQLMVFKEVGDAFLELWISFTELQFQTEHGEPMALQDVIAGGRRWWDSMYAGDGRTKSHGIVPGST